MTFALQGGFRTDRSRKVMKCSPLSLCPYGPYVGMLKGASPRYPLASKSTAKPPKRNSQHMVVRPGASTEELVGRSYRQKVSLFSFCSDTQAELKGLRMECYRARRKYETGRSFFKVLSLLSYDHSASEPNVKSPTHPKSPGSRLK